jgi:translation initiation factor 3 subunit H
MDELLIEHVQLDGSVVLKLIKHCEEEAMTGMNAATGTLYGLAKNKTLEITHCIPSPVFVMDESIDTAQQDILMQSFETDIVKHMRQVNIDYLNIGYYMSAAGGNFINRNTLESLYGYQSFVPESVLVVYDPTKVARGHVCIKAYRITKTLLAIMREAAKEEEKHVKSGVSLENVPEAEAFRKMRLNYTELLEEIPTVIRNSHLSNILLSDMENRLMHNSNRALNSLYSGLNLSASSSMERQIKYILNGLEKLQDDLNKNFLMQRALNRGTDISRMDRAIQVPLRLDSALLAAQVDYFCTEASSISEQSIYKLKVAKAIQDGKLQTE